MDASKILEAAKDAMSVRRAFGEPIERDGMLLVPVAVVTGGGGGGGGGDESGASGSGGGFGVWTRPVGVYVVRDGEVSFRPAFDVVALAAIGAALLGRLVHAKRRRRR